MKKLFPALLLSLLFGLFGGSSFAATQPVKPNQPRVILDQLLTGPVPALNAKDLNIPPDLASGFHELTVEVYNKKGVISSKTALFCKDLHGQLHFDNICPDLITKPVPPKPAPFNPYSHPDATISFLAVVLAIGGALVGMRRRTKDEGSDLGGADTGSLGVPKAEKSWGDRRWYINSRFMDSLDSLPRSIAKTVEKFSYLLARSVTDARYLRAIFGNLAWLTIPASLYFSYMGMRSIKNHALPFDGNLIVILALIGLFDAFAGIFAAFVYLDFTFASGNLNSLHAVFFALGFSLLFFAPGLAASKFRPLHRKVANFAGLWERITDYVLASLLTGWVSSKLVAALTGLIGYELKITESANMIGIFIGLALLVRLLLEEVAWYLYPYRLSLLQVDLQEPGLIQKLRGIIFKVGVMVLLAQPYIGWNRYLAGGIAIFLAPQLLSLFGDKLPSSKYIGQIVPHGALKIVWMGLIGVLVGTQIMHHNLGAKESILISFVILPLPSFIYSVLGAFSDSPVLDVKHPRFRYAYRVLSVIVLILLLLQILGHNPIREIHNAWLNPAHTWHSLTYKWWPYVLTPWHNLTHWISVGWHNITHWISVGWHNITHWISVGWHNVTHWVSVGWNYSSSWCASAWHKFLHWISTP